MTERPELLQERQKTHGSFARNAQISQDLKRYFRNKDSSRFIDVHQEALDMICLKLSRILSGQADFKDHWLDVSGYALLAAEACKDDQP